MRGERLALRKGGSRPKETQRTTPTPRLGALSLSPIGSTGNVNRQLSSRSRALYARPLRRHATRVRSHALIHARSHVQSHPYASEAQAHLNEHDPRNTGTAQLLSRPHRGFRITSLIHRLCSKAKSPTDRQKKQPWKAGLSHLSRPRHHEFERGKLPPSQFQRQAKIYLLPLWGKSVGVYGFRLSEQVGLMVWIRPYLSRPPVGPATSS